MLLKDKIAVVTGGTRGIGYAIVKAYLENGATVVLCGSKPETAQKAVDQLKTENPNWKVEGIAPNLTDYDSVKAAFDAVEKKYGRIDILVNNAGVSDSAKIGSYTPEMFQKTMDLNVNAVFNCTRAVVDGMKERHSGVILNTSSMVSKYGQPGGVAYPTSKFAVNGMTLSLARELAPDGIRVNAVAPGLTDTDMGRMTSEEVKTIALSRNIMKRLGQPEEIADAVVFLGSDLSRFMTGQVLRVDGGLL